MRNSHTQNVVIHNLLVPTPYTIMDSLDGNIANLKSPDGNTVWVRPPPALPDLRIKNSQVLFIFQDADTSIFSAHHCLENQDIQMLRFKERNNDSRG